MSFILSALKKVENKRNLGSVPELSSVQIQSFENLDNRRHRLGIVISIVGIVSVVIVTALWLYKPLLKQSATEPNMQSASIIAPAAEGITPRLPQPSAVRSPVVETPTPQTNAVPYVVRSNPTPAPAPVYYPPQPQNLNNDAATHPPTYTPAPSPHLYQNSADTPAWEPLPVGIVNYEDLPSGLRQRIPGIQLSAHIHSDLRPQARKVIINGVALREGQRLSDDLSIHQINSDGVVLDYQGTLFLLSKTSIFN